jgi:hypothetical protein
MALIGQQIEIQLSKIKLVLAVVGSLIFVGLGFWFVISPPSPQHFHRYSPTTILVAGYASIIFFGFCAVILIRKLPDNRPGLIIEEEGITDNSSGISSGKVLWSDISKISIIEIRNQRLILLQVNNPYDYINRQTNKFEKKLMEINYNRYGTPLSLTSNGLKISFNELHKLLVDNHDVTKEKARTANSTYQ